MFVSWIQNSAFRFPPRSQSMDLQECTARLTSRSLGVDVDSVSRQAFFPVELRHSVAQCCSESSIGVHNVTLDLHWKTLGQGRLSFFDWRKRRKQTVDVSRVQTTPLAHLNTDGICYRVSRRVGGLEIEPCRWKLLVSSSRQASRVARGQEQPTLERPDFACPA